MRNKESKKERTSSSSSSSFVYMSAYLLSYLSSIALCFTFHCVLRQKVWHYLRVPTPLSLGLYDNNTHLILTNRFTWDEWLIESTHQTLFLSECILVENRVLNCVTLSSFIQVSNYPFLSFFSILIFLDILFHVIL